MKRVMLTSASSTAARGVILGLQAAPEPVYMIGVDSSRYHILQAQGEVNELHLIPRADDESYIDVLSEIACESEADFIWPLHDAEIERLAAATGLPARTWVPPLDVCKRARDKMATYTALAAAGVPAPSSLLVETPDDLKRAFDQFGPDVWLRSRQGAGSRGAYCAPSYDLGLAWLEIHDGWGRFMAAEVMPGPLELSWESIWKGGELIAGQVETRLVRGNIGISLPGVSNRGVLLRDGPPEAAAVAELAVKAVMPVPDGIFRVDMISDASGSPRVTEVDAGRFGAGGVAYWYEFGYNWAYEALRIGMGEPIGYPVPVINPCPPDMASITGFNRKLSFIRMADVDALTHEYEARRKKGRQKRAV